MNEPFREPTEIPTDRHLQHILTSLKRKRYFHPKKKKSCEGRNMTKLIMYLLVKRMNSLTVYQ